MLAFHPGIRKLELNEKVAYLYGNLVLARDEQKEKADINQPFIALEKCGKLVVEKQEPNDKEMVRFSLDTDMGGVLLTDYASCGKKWGEENARISVWFKQK